MMPKFAASDDLKISQVQVISECEGSLNLSIRNARYYFMLVIFVYLTILLPQ